MDPTRSFDEFYRLTREDPERNRIALRTDAHQVAEL
jgi:hypothetical protein